MPEYESVSTSLIALSDLENDSLYAIDTRLDDENMSVIVYRQGDVVRAWWNICPHAGRRLDYAPGQFLRDQGQLVCASHGATFRLEDGVCVAGPCRGSSLREVPVRIDAEGVVHLQ